MKGVRGMRRQGAKGNCQYWQQGDEASKGKGNDMQYYQYQGEGGDAWGQSGTPTWAEHCDTPTWQSTAAQYSDIPPSNGQLSDALKHKLAEEDLLDMEVLCRYRGIRTLRALESLETTERAVLLCKARELYELLGIFPSNLKNTLNKLFGDVPQQGMFHSSK